MNTPSRRPALMLFVPAPDKGADNEAAYLTASCIHLYFPSNPWAAVRLFPQ